MLKTQGIETGLQRPSISQIDDKKIKLFKKICDLRKLGLTFPEIAKSVGTTASRAMSLYKQLCAYPQLYENHLKVDFYSYNQGPFCEEPCAFCGILLPPNKFRVQCESDFLSIGKNGEMVSYHYDCWIKEVCSC